MLGYEDREKLKMLNDFNLSLLCSVQDTKKGVGLNEL